MKTLLQHPTGLQGLAGGAAGGGGLTPGREEEDPACLPGGLGPATGEGTRALERGAQPP